MEGSRIVWQQGKKSRGGGVIGRLSPVPLDGDKIVLPAHGFAPKTMEVWWCNLIDKGNFYVGVPVEQEHPALDSEAPNSSTPVLLLEIERQRGRVFHAGTAFHLYYREQEGGPLRSYAIVQWCGGGESLEESVACLILPAWVNLVSEKAHGVAGEFNMVEWWVVPATHG